jgi:PIN like domain
MSTASGRPRPRKSDLILLVDRCLAPEVALEISKMDGLYGIALHEHYGNEAAQHLADITFLAEAGRQGWGVLTQNPRMWQVPQERACIIENHTRVFSLDDPNGSKTLKGLVLGRHLLSVRRRMSRVGPCFWRLRLQAVRKDLA